MGFIINVFKNLLNRVLGVLACSRAFMLTCSAILCAYVLDVLVCSRACMLSVLGMLACLVCLRAWLAYVLTCLVCPRNYVFACLACLLALCPYMLTCLTYLLYSNILRAYVLACFFDIICPIFFTFEKLTSKNIYIEKFIFIQRNI